MIHIDERPIRYHVDQVVRATVEETLNQLLEAEADRLCGAGRYERSADRVDTRAGSCPRQLVSKIWNSEGQPIDSIGNLR